MTLTFKQGTVITLISINGKSYARVTSNGAPTAPYKDVKTETEVTVESVYTGTLEADTPIAVDHNSVVGDSVGNIYMMFAEQSPV